METKANFVMLGASTVVGVILIMMFALWLANSEFSRGYKEFDVVFSDPVRGLATGGEVRFNGIKVGEVTSLRIDPDNTNRVIARIRVSSEIPVRRDSVAQLEPVGLTGVTLIQLNAGSASQELLRAAFGAGPPRIPGRGSQIDAILNQGQDIAMRASEAMAQVRNLLTDENIEKVSAILNDLETISDRLAAQNSVITRSGEAAASLTRAADSITALTQQTQHDLQGLDLVLSDVRDASRTASGQTLPELTLAIQEIRRAANSVNRVAAGLEDNPSVLTPRPQRPIVELRP